MSSPGRTTGLREFASLIDIQNIDTLKLSNLIQIGIIGDDFSVDFFGQFDELGVDLFHGRVVGIDDPDVHVDLFLDVTKDFQSPLSPGPFDRIRRIGNMLKFAQYKLRNEERAFHETGFHDVRNAAVDDHAGVENLGIFSSREVLRVTFSSGKMDLLPLFQAR
jgi:hypothetical protein